MSMNVIGVVAKYNNAFGTFSSVFSVGAGIYGAVSSVQAGQVVNAKLDQILKNQEKIINQLQTIVVQADWHASKVLINEPITAIRSWSKDLVGFTDIAKGDQSWGTSDAGQAAIQSWTVKVLLEAHKHLDAINDAIMGEGAAEKPIMEVFADKIKRGLGLQSHTKYESAVSFFESLLAIQQQGIICLGSAYVVANQKKDASGQPMLPDYENVLKTLGRHLKVDGVNTFKRQAEHSKQYIESLASYCDDIGRYRNEGPDYIAFGISSKDAHDVFGIDETPLVTDEGHIVVGFQFYGHHRRLMLKLAQVPFSKWKAGKTESWIENWKDYGADLLSTPSMRSLPSNLSNDQKVQEYNKQFSEWISKWKPRCRASHEDWSKYFSRYKDVFKDGVGYLDIQKVEVPEGEVVTGAQLYYKSDRRISLRLQSAKLNLDGDFLESSRHWTEAPFNLGREGSEYYMIRGSCKYISRRPLVPKPLTPIRGGFLFFHDDGDAYFMHVGVKPGLFDIDDVWKKYDMYAPSNRLMSEPF